MRRRDRERGQILPIVALALVAMLGIGAFGIDVGYAYYAKRQLQSATDAAALAGAQDLPSAFNAKATAVLYAGYNTPANLSSVTFTYTTKCTATATAATGCDAANNPNALTVTAEASTKTWFAKLFGISHFDVAAKANACSPCSSTPVDVVVVLDRTGSMCLPNCSDMQNAKTGVRTMLDILNPPYAQVGMIAFPPVQSTTSDVCGEPFTVETTGVPNFHTNPSNDLLNYTGYDAAGRGYLTDAISANFKADASGMQLHTDPGNQDSCVRSDGLTSYSEALRQAQAELAAHGRPNIPNFIVFFTDGEANIGSVYSANHATFGQTGKDDQQPCQAGIDAATAIKATGTKIYSIGYGLGSATYCTHGTFRKYANSNWNTTCTAYTTGCYHFASTGALKESPNITSMTAVSKIASQTTAPYFQNAPSSTSLSAVFSKIATDIASGSSRLVDDAY
jgi:Flp pilus assembly protein TadG